MTTSQKKTFARVRSCPSVVTLTDKSGAQSKIVMSRERRGYQTNYERKNFFYLLINNRAYGITGDSRRKNFIAFWKKNNINFEIHDEKLFQELIA